MTGRGWERGSVRSTVVALAGLALVAGAGCQSKDNSDDDELLALWQRLESVRSTAPLVGALDLGTSPEAAPPEAAPPVEALRSDLTPEERRTMFRLALEKRGLRT